jgi:putative transcriptional regulator
MAEPHGPAPVEHRMRSRRQAAGLNQQELARSCGLTRQAINAVEAGHYVPSTLVALRIARALGGAWRISSTSPRNAHGWKPSGMSDVGPGILALARALGLDFIPLQEERYDLIIPHGVLERPRLPGVARNRRGSTVPGGARRIR